MKISISKSLLIFSAVTVFCLPNAAFATNNDQASALCKKNPACKAIPVGGEGGSVFYTDGHFLVFCPSGGAPCYVIVSKTVKPKSTVAAKEADFLSAKR